MGDNRISTTTLDEDFQKALAANGPTSGHKQETFEGRRRYTYEIGDHVAAGVSWTSGHGTVVKINPKSIGVRMETGEATGRQFTIPLLGGNHGEWINHVDDPLITRWLARHPAPEGTRAPAVAAARRKVPVASATMTGRIAKTRTKLVDEIFAKAKKVTYYHYDEMHGSDRGETTPEVAKKALYNMRSTHLSNDGGGTYTVHVHSNQWYTIHT